MADSGGIPPVPATGAPVAKARAAVAWRGLALAGVLVLLGALAVLLAEILDDNASLDERRWFGHLAAFAGILTISAIVAAIHAAAVRKAMGAEQGATSPPGILIGADNRLSTSKLAAYAWTWALAWAILSLAIADWVGAPAGWGELVDQGIQDAYLVLLGGPFLALVGAKALVASGVQNGTQVKTEVTEEQTPLTRVSQAFSDDNGQTDLVDTQYLVFGAIALLVFIVAFLRDAGAGLPDMPDFIVAVASVGATAYIANKAVARDAPPHLDRVVPDRAAPGAVVTVFGRNLLSVSQGGRRAATTDHMNVFLGSLAVIAVAPRGSHAQTTASGSDWFKFTVPRRKDLAADNGEVAVALSVQNAVGTLADNTISLTLVLS